MATLFDKDGPSEDVWFTIDGDQPIPADQDIIVSLDFYREHREALLGRNAGRFGVHLEAGEGIDELESDLNHIALISLDFPSFADGRSFSKARWLRGRHGYEGKVRAVGDVRIDQVDFLKRCGFSNWLISHEATIEGLTNGADPSLSLHYQPAVGDETAAKGYSWRRMRG